jgi:hypothetical protein
METGRMKTGKSAAQWISLAFRFAFRCLAAVLLFIYVLLGVTATKELYKRNIIRAQDISTFNTVIDDAVQKDDTSAVTTWLRARPLAETDKLVEMVTPKSGVLEPAAFIEIFRRELDLGRTEEALFWLQMGRYRLRFDIIRCGAETDALKSFDKTFNRARRPETDALLQAHPETLKKALRRVLDFDAKYPAHDNPAAICKAISKALPAGEASWDVFRQSLRKHTEEFIDAPDKANVPAEKKSGGTGSSK